MIHPFFAILAVTLAFNLGAYLTRRRFTRYLTIARIEAERLRELPYNDGPAENYARARYILGFADGALTCATGKPFSNGIEK